MKALKDKIRLIYIPFLLIVVGFAAIYTFLHWFLFIKIEVFSLRKEVVDFWLPMVLPWIPILVWLRPRVKLLSIREDRSFAGYLVIAWLAVAGPTIIAQEYLQTATGKLTPLENINQFDKKPPTRYYTLQHYFIDKRHAGIQHTIDVSGRQNSNLNFGFYVAMPILNSEADTAKGAAVYWLCKKYSKTVSNNLSDREKEKKYKLFITEAQLGFDTTNFGRFTYLEKAGNSDMHDRFNEAIRMSDREGVENVIAFTFETGAFSVRNGKKLQWIFLALGIGCGLWFMLLLFVDLPKGRVEKFRAGVRAPNTDTKEILSVFIPRKDYWVTPIIVHINILVYLIMVFCGLGVLNFRAPDLLHWGGNFRPSTTNGQYWRLLTSVFLHGGAFHLLANMAGLLFAGVLLEPALGSKKFLLAYLLSGIFASCASLWWHPATVSVGASGAIFGMYGSMLALMILKAVGHELRGIFLIVSVVFIGYNLLMGFFGHGVDNAAHIGGLLAGSLIGLVMSRFVKKARRPFQ